MSDQRYRTAAVLTLVKTGLVLLMFLFLIFMTAAKRWGIGPVLFRGFVLILAGGLEAYVLLTLRRLLWDRYDFHRTDTIIAVLACAAVVLEILNQLTEVAQVLSPGQEGKVIAARILFIIVPWGIIIIVYAAGLLKLPFSEKSLLRPYAYVNLVAGILLISTILALALPIFGLFLFPFLLLTEIASAVLLALTFLRSRETEQVEFV
ncbi:MAG TPA: hypothetical protein VMS75_02120 [Terriglobales bacterium]|nr:hypothetical protein [Terriglobales bacterium]